MPHHPWSPASGLPLSGWWERGVNEHLGFRGLWEPPQSLLKNIFKVHSSCTQFLRRTWRVWMLTLMWKTSQVVTLYQVSLASLIVLAPSILASGITSQMHYLHLHPCGRSKISVSQLPYKKIQILWGSHGSMHFGEGRRTIFQDVWSQHCVVGSLLVTVQVSAPLLFWAYRTIHVQLLCLHREERYTIWE